MTAWAKMMSSIKAGSPTVEAVSLYLTTNMGSNPIRPTMTTDKEKENSIAKDKNCEVIPCRGKDCDNETVVLQKDNIISYTCPVCYNIPR